MKSFCRFARFPYVHIDPGSVWPYRYQNEVRSKSVPLEASETCYVHECRNISKAIHRHGNTGKILFSGFTEVGQWLDSLPGNIYDSKCIANSFPVHSIPCPKAALSFKRSRRFLAGQPRLPW